MAVNRAIIPLYVNENLLNNLFTVVVQEFVQIKTISNKHQQVIKISTPLSNVMQGRFIQGTFTLELLDEYANQRTEEKISKTIVVLLETKGILEAQNLLKKVSSSQDIDSIEEDDYIEFKCRLNKNPQIEQMEDIIRYMEMKNTFSPGDKDNNPEVLSLLKSHFEEWKKSRCLKFFTDGLFDSNTRAVVPLQLRYMQDNIDHLYNNNVTIMGKVVKVKNGNNNEDIDLSSGTYYDFLDEDHFKGFRDEFLKGAPIDEKDYKNDLQQEDNALIEVLPIAMYI